MDLKITPSGQTIVKPTALGPGANTDTKLLIYGLFQKGRVLAQDDQEPETFRRSLALRKQESGPRRGVGLTGAARRHRDRRLRSGVWLR